MKRSPVTLLALSALSLIGLTGCSEVNAALDQVEQMASPSTSAQASEQSQPGTTYPLTATPEQRLNNYVDVLPGQAQIGPACDIEPGAYHYTGIINRAGQVGPACTVVNLSDTVQRVDPKDDPAGYTGNNTKTSIPLVSGVTKKTTYNGEFYNRSHMISASLGGSPYEENLITGTRMQNTGENMKGGMRAPELFAEKYVKDGKAVTCPLTYQVTPNYQNDTDALPVTVTVDMVNCDGSVNTRYVTYNDAAGFTIDYATGQWTKN